MPPVALALVLTAALLHALWNIAAKKAGGNHHFALLSVLMTVGLWAPAALWVGTGERARCRCCLLHSSADGCWAKATARCAWPVPRASRSA